MNDKNNEIIFSVTVEDLQDEAINRINRGLTDDELDIAKKCIESGLSFGIETVIKTAIEEAVDKNRQTKQRRI